MNERDIEEIAPHLGSDAAARVDLDRVAERVVAELRAKPAPVVWWRSTAVLRAAAVGAVLLTGGLAVERLVIDRPASVVALVTPVGLEECSSAELAEVLDSLDQMTPVYELVPASLDDLDETELGDLLAAMEG